MADGAPEWAHPVPQWWLHAAPYWLSAIGARETLRDFTNAWLQIVMEDQLWRATTIHAGIRWDVWEQLTFATHTGARRTGSLWSRFKRRNARTVAILAELVAGVVALGWVGGMPLKDIASF